MNQTTANVRTQKSSYWRADVQGIRALAVVMVVAVHSGLPVPGGFIGVDVFFVVSGFVISQLLIREFQTSGEIRLMNFYLKRFMRLMPALGVLVCVTVVAAGFLLSPFGAQQITAWTGIGAMLSVANIVIAITTGNYFDDPAELNPLLHTWSLSVEEQFYLFFPALLLVALLTGKTKRQKRKIPMLVISFITLISFLYLLMSSTESLVFGPPALHGFYSPVTRIWEFGVGAILALAITNRSKFLSNEKSFALGLLGFAVIVSSLWIIDESKPYPSMWTVLPVSGTALLLMAGQQPRNFVTRSLSSSFLVRIGDCSYSIYLWHWPPIVFASYIWPTIKWAPFLAAVLSIPLALASYYFIEKRFRGRSVRVPKKLIVGIVATPIVLSSIVGLTAREYWIPRYESGQVPVLLEGSTEWLPFYEQLEAKYYQCSNTKIRELSLDWEGIKRCRQSLEKQEIDVVLLGDSHAEHLFVGLAETFPDTNLAFYILSALPVEDSASMSLILDEVVSDSNVKTVVVNAAWALRGTSEQELNQALTRLTNSGKRVIVFDDVPIFPFDAKVCASGKSPFIPIYECSMDRKVFDQQHSWYAPVLRKISSSNQNIDFYETSYFFCGTELCDMRVDGQLAYRDSNHLNEIGSRFLSKRLFQEHSELKQFFIP